jgi:solute carrier family 35 (UDP-sugar transporter), member A1/2/3
MKFIVMTDWSLSSSLIVAGFPACLYAVQGVLTYIGYQSLDPLTFNGLMQTKTLSAALFSFILLGQGQSWVQMAALAILTVSALLFQGSEHRNSIARTSAPRPSGTVRLGVFASLVATTISGLAGCLSQKGLQMTGISGRNVYLYTVEISFYSAVCLCLSVLSNRSRSCSRGSFFESWTPSTLVPIVLKAFGGLLTAFVHKHAGSVTKGFAFILGLVLTGVIQAVLDKKTLSRDQMLGTGLVLLSSWLYFMFPLKH